MCVCVHYFFESRAILFRFHYGFRKWFLPGTISLFGPLCSTSGSL